MPAVSLIFILKLFSFPTYLILAPPEKINVDPNASMQALAIGLGKAGKVLHTLSLMLKTLASV